MIPFSPEIITAGIGATIGFASKIVGISIGHRQKVLELALKSNEQASKLADKASERTPTNFGKVTRRIIVFVILGLFVALFFTPFFDINTVVEVKEKTPKWLFGLFGGNEKTSFEVIDGYYFSNSVQQTLILIISYYFGMASARA